MGEVFDTIYIDDDPVPGVTQVTQDDENAKCSEPIKVCELVYYDLWNKRVSFDDSDEDDCDDEDWHVDGEATLLL